MNPEYEAFLAAKAPRAQAVGMEPGPMPEHLFDYQRDCVAFALRQGRAALFLDTGLGKTACMLEWAAQCVGDGMGLILTPLAVARQIEREGKRWGYDIRVIRDQSEAGPGINVCNYDRLDKLDCEKFDAVALDECFAKGTIVDTPNGSKCIENLSPGDYILNAIGVDKIRDVHRREVQYAISVSIGGKSFISSPNHPIFTQRGWVGAQNLRIGDHALATREAVHLVRKSVLPKIVQSIRPEILRDILLSEMADETARDISESAFEGSCNQTGDQKSPMVCIGQPQSDGGNQTHKRIEPNFAGGCSQKDLPEIARNEPHVFRTWGEWQTDAITAVDTHGLSWQRMDSGICSVVGEAGSQLSHLLQNRLRQSYSENRDRGGWSIAYGEETFGCEERCQIGFVRVDGIEVLEQGHPELEKLRDADGKLYFYDLGATRHPSYSVNGFLVHNSSILKSMHGSTRKELTERFACTRFRLCCTATPAPNDHMELGNHAEFLGIMSGQEMLARWFINDTAQASQSWRLKGHAVTAFWDWVASWARCAETPADLGYDASRFVLPPMEITRHKAAGEVKPEDGSLFAADVSATTMHAVKRQTAQSRAEMAASLIAKEPEEPWLVWLDTDYEADAVCAALSGCIDLRGSMTPERKEDALDDFVLGRKLVMATKPGIAGAGLNLQHCARMIFVGRTFSYEAWYQAVRRCHRFGQTRPVHVHLIVAEGEDQIGRVIDRKAAGHVTMKREMAKAMRRDEGATSAVKVKYNPTVIVEAAPWL